jgi:4a-hydroxytetrahydrobiopterin dehydratase
LTATPARLDTDALSRALRAVPDWQSDGKHLRRTFRFPDFVAAFGFMAQVALVAERMDHHPDWSNSYGVVAIALSTHSAGGLTRRDIELAEAIDRIAAG